MQHSERLRRLHWEREYLWLIAAFLTAAGISVALFVLRDWVNGLGAFGYLGGFAVSLISGTGLVAAPGWALNVSLGSTLNPILVGLIFALGGTIGEMVGYGLGYTGHHALGKLPRYETLVRWMRRRGGLTIFLLALLPNPLFETAALAAGALQYSMWRFIAFSAAGRIPKSLLYAYVGAWGLQLFWH